MAPTNMGGRIVWGGLVLALAAAGAADVWQAKPPAEWTQEEALAVLGDSPWGQRVTLLQQSGRMLVELRNGTEVVAEDGSGRLPLPAAAESIPRSPELLEAVYAVRWSSAKVVQQALNRLKELSPTMAEMQAAPSELSAEHYVLTARVVQPPTESGIARAARPLAYTLDDSRPPQPAPPPPVPDLFAGLRKEELRERAELRTATKLRLKPERVERHGVGAGEGITFFFPRQQNGQATLPAGTAWAEFVFTGRKKETLKVRFKLAEMQVRGQADY